MEEAFSFEEKRRQKTRKELIVIEWFNSANEEDFSESLLGEGS